MGASSGTPSPCLRHMSRRASLPESCDSSGGVLAPHSTHVSSPPQHQLIPTIDAHGLSRLHRVTGVSQLTLDPEIFAFFDCCVPEPAPSARDFPFATSSSPPATFEEVDARVDPAALATLDELALE